VTAAKYPVHARFIAELQILEDAPNGVRKTLGAERYTLWCEPKQFLALVVSATAAAERFATSVPYELTDPETAGAVAGFSTEAEALAEIRLLRAVGCPSRRL
jgi:hypothetical protein